MIPIEVINELQNEIGEMESTVLYFEKRIIQKRIALWELIQSHASNEVVIKPLTVFEMVSTTLSEFNGGLIPYKELRDTCVKKFPDSTLNIKGNFSTICKQLINLGKKIEAPPSRSVKLS